MDICLVGDTSNGAGNHRDIVDATVVEGGLEGDVAQGAAAGAEEQVIIVTGPRSTARTVSVVLPERLTATRSVLPPVSAVPGLCSSSPPGTARAGRPAPPKPQSHGT